MPLVSVIVPILPVPDDVPCLERTLQRLGDDPRVEIIVVRGGEWTPAWSVLKHSGPHVLWLNAPRGRATQMNVGACHARGLWLLFLHADTQLAPGWVDEIAGLSSPSRVVGGSFRFQLDSPVRWARLVEHGVAARVRWCNLPYGDQALFVRRGIFDALGGYRELPLMEDVDLVRRMRRLGALHHSSLPATTSARRWEGDGWISRSLENVVLLLLFLASVDPRRLADRYRRARNMRDHGPSPRVGA